MKTKKLLLIGAIALVITCCVIAAGCTSTTTTPTVSDDILVGAWTCTDDEGVHTIVMKNDGTGFVTTIAKEDGTRIVKHSKFTWTKNADGTITHTLEKETSPVTLTYNVEKETLLDNLQHTLAKQEPITGIWYNEGTLGDKNAKFSNIFKPDGTGVLGAELEDGTTKVVESTWKKNADGTYTVTYASGFTNSVKLDETKNILSSATATNRTMTKKFADSSYYMSILGPWYNEEKRALTFFNADGTYSIILNKEKIGEGTWEDIPGFGKFALHVNVGMASGENVSGQDRFWTYDRVNNTITAQNGVRYVRPSAAVGDLTYEKFTAEPIVGQWTAKYQNDGKTVDAVLILGNDGNGYWATMGDVEGIQLTDIEKDTWKNTGDNSYQITDSTAVYDMVYDTASDALKGKRIVYTRLEPIVGIWYSTLAKEKSNNTASHLFKPDGTGVATVAYDDGSSKVFKMTWKKNNDGTYAITYPDGEKVTYSIDAAGNTITTGSGATKSKVLYRDMTLLSSIIGAWYDKDNDASFLFNADGTGIFKYNNSTASFTWKLKDNGKYELTYTGGTWGDGTDAKGKVSEWTYDRENNVFISSVGIKNTRPAESVKDKITLFS